MASGGSRAKSGPTKDPSSRTSAREGFLLTALPAAGYRKRPPGLTRYIPRPTARQKAIWVELWKTPQACAWSQDQWRWPTVAILCRLMARAEDPDAPAAIYSELAKLQTRLGLSEEGLRYLGWQIKHDEVTPRRTAQSKKKTEDDLPPLRLQSVPS